MWSVRHVACDAPGMPEWTRAHKRTPSSITVPRPGWISALRAPIDTEAGPARLALLGIECNHLLGRCAHDRMYFCHVPTLGMLVGTRLTHRPR